MNFISRLFILFFAASVWILCTSASSHPVAQPYLIQSLAKELPINKPKQKARKSVKKRIRSKKLTRYKNIKSSEVGRVFLMIGLVGLSILGLYFLIMSVVSFWYFLFGAVILGLGIYFISKMILNAKKRKNVEAETEVKPKEEKESESDWYKQDKKKEEDWYEKEK